VPGPQLPKPSKQLLAGSGLLGSGPGGPWPVPGRHVAQPAATNLSSLPQIEIKARTGVKQLSNQTQALLQQLLVPGHVAQPLLLNLRASPSIPSSSPSPSVVWSRK
jgi:hypothetical protein